MPIIDIMLQILREVKSSRKDNKQLRMKVLNLEKTVSELREEASNKKCKRIIPSLKERVRARIESIPLSCMKLCYILALSSSLQDHVRKIYKSLSDSDENFGWILKYVYGTLVLVFGA